MASSARKLAAGKRVTPGPVGSAVPALEWIESHFAILAPLLIVTHVVIVFAGVFQKKDTIISRNGDMGAMGVPWCTFEIRQVWHGILPLWNPHCFGGTPFLGNFNSALFYPLYWFIYVLPLPFALNLIFALHTFLAGWFTAIWCRHRGISTISSITAGVIFMFSGSYFAHSIPGHGSIFSSSAYIPLILLAIDGLFDSGNIRWAGVGALAVGLQALASFPQIIYYTGLIAVIYTLFRLAASREPLRKRLLIVALCGGMYVVGPAIGAIALIPGLASGDEALRARGTDESFSGSCPIPPENLLTSIAPGLWGDVDHHPMHATMWEVSLYTGCTTLLLAIYGAVAGEWSRRHFAGTLLVIVLVLSLGRNIGWLYHFLFLHLPGYSSVRVTARWNQFVALFVAMLAALGLDRLVKRQSVPASLLVVGIGATVLIGIAAAMVTPPAIANSDCLWERTLASLPNTPERINALSSTKSDPQFITETGYFAGKQLLLAALAMAAATGALAMSRMDPRRSYLIALVVLSEMTTYALATRPTTSINELKENFPARWNDARLTSRLPDTRVFNCMNSLANLGMQEDYDDGYGYDPVVGRRYAQFLAYVSLVDPDRLFFPPVPNLLEPDIQASQRANRLTARVRTNSLVILPGHSEPGPVSALPFLQLLRCQLVFAQPIETRQGLVPPVWVSDPMPRLSLMQNWQSIPGRDERLAALTTPDFNLYDTAILERPPPISIGPAAQTGSVRLIRETCNELEIDADVAAPSLLLITDAYARGWRARSLDAAPTQRGYEIMPADQMMRAVPLQKGHHHLLLEYVPPGYVAGRFITLATLFGLVVGCLLFRGSRQFNASRRARHERVS